MSYINNDFSRLCDEDGVCHCDWRLTVYGCEEGAALKAIYIVEAVFSGFCALLVFGLLCHRVFKLKQTLLDYRSTIPRPKPIETMGIFGLIFSVLRMIHAIIIVTDAAPNVAFRSFFYELPWLFGIGALTCYFFGIANTLSDSSRTLYEAWIRSPIVVDSICVAIVFLPFFTNNLCSIAAGIFALHGKPYVASNFTKAAYYLWGIYAATLALLIIYAGIRLIRLLDKHLLRRKSGSIDINRVHTAVLKVRIIVIVSTFCLLLFTGLVFWYASERENTIMNRAKNLAICVFCAYAGAITTVLIALAVTINPQMAALLAGSGIQSSNYEQSAAVEVPPRLTMSESRPDQTNTFSWSFNERSLNQRQTTFLPLPPLEIRTQIEEEQHQYIAMTSGTRIPPRNTSPTTEDRQLLSSGSAIAASMESSVTKIE